MRSTDTPDQRSLYLVTGNAHKVEECTRLLSPYPLLSLRDYPLPSEPVEDGQTFVANSLIKSRAGLAHAHELGLDVLSIADDSGLEVDALHGAPGVRSARYAPGSDVDRYMALLDALEVAEALTPAQRVARFRCALSVTGLTERDERRLFSSPALASSLHKGDRLTFHRLERPDGVVIRSVCALGTFEGSIALTPSGASGFGYDPIFIPQGARSSVAELSAQEKDALSHRGDALRLLTPVLHCLYHE